MPRIESLDFFDQSQIYVQKAMAVGWNVAEKFVGRPLRFRALSTLKATVQDDLTVVTDKMILSMQGILIDENES